jgi:hypothetical protein
MTNDATNEPKPETIGRFSETAEHVGRDILVAVVELLKRQKRPFADLNEGQQNADIMAITAAIRQAVHRGFAAIMGGEFPHAQATLDKVAFTPKGVQGTLSPAGSSEYRHALSDHVGRGVIVVLASAEQYLESMNQVRAEADQRQLELPTSDDTSGLNEERHRLDDDGAPDPSPPSPTILEDANPGPLTLEHVVDALALIEQSYPLETISGWDQPTRKLVVDFCAALAIKEQGGDVTVPARPDVLGEEAA